MTKWFNQLNSTWQSLVVLGGVFAFALTITAVAYPVYTLPETVEENAELIKGNSSLIQGNTDRIEKVEVNQQDLLDAIKLSNCLDLAQAQNTPYQTCLDQ